MKKYLAFAALAAGMILAFGCTKEKSFAVEEGPQVTMTITAEIPATRITYSGTNGSPTAKWEAGDKLYLVKKGSVIRFGLVDGGNAKGKFTTHQEVTSGTYLPIIVSKSSEEAGYVTLAADGSLTLNLGDNPLGTYEDALKRDVIFGEPLVVSPGQTEAQLSGLAHALSFIKLVVTGSGISRTGLYSRAGLYSKIVFDAASTEPNATKSEKLYPIDIPAAVSGSNAVVYVPVFRSTAKTLVAYAETQSNDIFETLISDKDLVEYDPGVIYQKTVALNKMEQVQGTATSTNDAGVATTHQWRKLHLGGLKWATHYVDMAQPNLETPYEDIGFTANDPEIPNTDFMHMILFRCGATDWIRGASPARDYVETFWSAGTDVAKVHWGGAWKMPTSAEIGALANDEDLNQTYVDDRYAWSHYANYVLVSQGAALNNTLDGNYISVKHVGVKEVSTGLSLLFPATAYYYSYSDRFDGNRTYFRIWAFDGRWNIGSDVNQKPTTFVPGGYHVQQGAAVRPVLRDSQ